MAQFSKQNMRYRGPMESRKLQDNARQIERHASVLKGRIAALKEMLGDTGKCIESGDIPGSIEGSLYRQAEQVERQISSLERREMNE